MTATVDLRQIIELDRHLEDQDITTEHQRLAAVLLEKIEEARLTPFMRAMRETVTKRGLSIAQARAVLNEVRRLYGEKRDARGRVVPDATYTIVLPGDKHATMRVRTQPETARFAPGRTIVSYLHGGDNERDYVGFGFLDNGELVLWKKFHGNTRLVDAVRVLVGDPVAAAKAYALKSGRCCVCGRKLTVPSSIEMGIGPECASKFSC